jgi:hypothetical protein
VLTSQVRSTCPKRRARRGENDSYDYGDDWFHQRLVPSLCFGLRIRLWFKQIRFGYATFSCGDFPLVIVPCGGVCTRRGQAPQ